VVSVIHSAAFGGPHNQAAHLHRILPSQAGIDVTVVLPDEAGDAAARLRTAGVPVVQMRLIRPRASLAQLPLWRLLSGYPGQVWRLYRLLKVGGYDVVEVHGLLNFDAALAGRLAGRGVVWQLIDTRPPMILRRALMPLVSLLADVVMTTGEAVAGEYPGARWRRNRWRPFVPPVDLPPVDAARDDDRRRLTRQRLGVDRDALLVASIGNLNPQKGFEGLIDAVAACREGAPGLALRIRGSEQSGHEDYAAGLSGRATALGLSPETVATFEDEIGVSDLMVASDVFALTSTPRSEGIPTVVLEAMARRLPVVCTSVGAVAEIVTDGEDGLVVPPDDAESLVRALKRVAADESLRQRLGAAGRRTVAVKADPAAFARIHADAYQAAFDRRRWRRRVTSAGKEG
jgi:glycosyltransferase involved in cell wall biosynthesis